MPFYNYFRRRKYNRYLPYRRRWRRIRRRPTRKAFLRRKRLYRVRRRRKILKKLKKIKITEWQPTTIKKCTVKGILCLFQCGINRIHHNWGQYQESYVPVKEPGGGGWSALVINLGALYQEYQHCRNWWTQSNKGLPLARYNGCKLKFYRSYDTDYVVTIQKCPPFVDTELLHLEAQPSRQLMNKHKIIVPNMTRKWYKKPYITKRFSPPALMQNKWYFQQDLCNTNLLLILTSACSLDQYFLPNTSISNNITLIALDTTLFTQPNFATISETTGYTPKNGIYLYASEQETTPTKWSDLIYLGNTIRYQQGKPLTSQTLGDKSQWGNPFYPDYLENDIKVWYTNKKPPDNFPTGGISTVHALYRQCRYNPHKDTGIGNMAFFKSTSISTGNIWDPPKDPELTISGFPLWLLLWGWDDWQRKLKKINQININYYLVILSDFVSPKLPGYIFLDLFFLQHDKHTDISETDKANWHPRLEYQEESIDEICASGPGAPKINHSRSIQAKMLYQFYFKWGGCPAPMQEIKDPCQQGKFPIPNKEQYGLEIEDPKVSKYSHLYYFDEKQEQLTKRAAKRLKSTTIFDESFTDGNKLNPPPKTLSEESEKSETEEETHQTPEQLQQLKLLRSLRKHIRHRLTKLKQRL
uniref:Capsid protein n=1 Tax=Betatorquevirus 009A TaxID=3163410 RepID=A0AAU7SSP2_9VIRU